MMWTSWQATRLWIESAEGDSSGKRAIDDLPCILVQYTSYYGVVKSWRQKGGRFGIARGVQ